MLPCTAFKIDDTQQPVMPRRVEIGNNAAGVTKGKRMVELKTVGRDGEYAGIRIRARAAVQ